MGEIEVWKDVISLKGLYEISNRYRIRSLDKDIVNSIGRKCFIKGVILNPIIPINRYPYITIREGKKKRNIYIHRLIAIHFLPNPENKPCVNHINGIKSDNRIENLEWCTVSENSIHAFKNNLQVIKKGEDCCNSKLTEKNVIAIKRLYRLNRKFNRSRVAEKLNVNVNTVMGIIKNRNWNHITI